MGSSFHLFNDRFPRDSMTPAKWSDQSALQKMLTFASFLSKDLFPSAGGSGELSPAGMLAGLAELLPHPTLATVKPVQNLRPLQGPGTAAPAALSSLGEEDTIEIGDFATELESIGAGAVSEAQQESKDVQRHKKVHAMLLCAVLPDHSECVHQSSMLSPASAYMRVCLVVLAGPGQRNQQQQDDVATQSLRQHRSTHFEAQDRWQWCQQS